MSMLLSESHAVPSRNTKQLRLHDQVILVLENSGYRPLSRIECRVDSAGVVELLGTVPTFYLKQLAQELILKSCEISRIENSLAVS